MHIFSGLYKSRKILSPKGQKTRPTSGRLREALFNICQLEIKEAVFLDLFSGSGAMGIEALSRGANEVVFVDNSRESIRCIQSNLAALGIVSKAQVIYSDVFDAMKKLAKCGCHFDVIYADPPYDTFISSHQGNHSLSDQVLTLLDELLELKFLLLKRGGMLFLEDALDSQSLQKSVKNLILKDKRNMGRSALQQWTHPVA